MEIHDGQCIQIGGHRHVGAYSQRLDLPDDFEVIVSYESSLSAHSHLIERLLSPQQGRTTWVMGKSWELVNDTQNFLDPMASWYEEELSAEIYESHVFKQASVDERPQKKKWNRTGVSVGIALSVCVTQGILTWNRNVPIRPGKTCTGSSTSMSCYIEKEGENIDMTNTVPIDRMVWQGGWCVAPPEFQCCDCFLDDLVCKSCCIQHHRREPLHWIQVRHAMTFQGIVMLIPSSIGTGVISRPLPWGK